MHERAVACPDRFHGGAGRQHCGRPVELVNPVGVPGRGPAVQAAVICQPGLVVVDDEDAIGQLAEQCRVGDAGPVYKATLPVQHLVDVVRRGFRGKVAGRRPGRQERLIGGVAAFRARPVTGGQRDRLVEEEQLGIAARAAGWAAGGRGTPARTPASGGPGNAGPGPGSRCGARPGCRTSSRGARWRSARPRASPGSAADGPGQRAGRRRAPAGVPRSWSQCTTVPPLAQPCSWYVDTAHWLVDANS